MARPAHHYLIVAVLWAAFATTTLLLRMASRALTLSMLRASMAVDSHGQHWPPLLGQLAGAALVRLPLRTTCLSRSLALSAVARLVGVRTTVRLGVEPGEAAAAGGHAWLECDGRAVAAHIDPPARFPFDTARSAEAGRRPAP